MACDDPDYPGKDVAPDTHVHPNWAVHPKTGDRYSPYNKPASIVHWLEHAKPTADYVVILDADMVIRKAITAEAVGVERGRPISAEYGYLKGVYASSYMKVKERVRNVDKAQQVGGFSVMHLEDLKVVAPLWLKWTEEVRQDPDSWANTGDIYNDNGKKGPPWIAEMYGYVFACAEAGLDFKVSNDFMLYPGYQPKPEPWPMVLHYGITYNVDWYAFDKHWYMATDMTKCPGKVFPRPPKPEDLQDKPGSRERRRKEIALVVAWGLYEASKAWTRDHCGHEQPDPPEKRYVCAFKGPVWTCDEEHKALARAARTGAAQLRGAGAATANPACKNENEFCCDWAEKGECDRNADFMLSSCKLACGECPDAPAEEVCAPDKQAEDETTPQPQPSPRFDASGATLAQARATAAEGAGDGEAGADGGASADEGEDDGEAAAEEEEEDGEGDGGESERWMADYHPDASHQGSYSAPAPRAVGSQVATWNVVLWMMALLALVFALGRSSAPVWPGQPNSSTAFQQWRARRRGPRSSTDRTE